MTRRELQFGPDYCEQVTLRDGSTVLLRAIGAGDKELLRDGFERMSPESRYRRFFSVKTRLTDAELRYLTEVDGVDHFALGAVRVEDDGTERGLGVGRVIRVSGCPGTAEAAIAVVDEAQGLGLGSMLFRRLVAAAIERGVERLRSEVLSDNKPMLDLLRRLAPDVSVSVTGPVVTVEIPIAPVEVEVGAARQVRPLSSALYELLRLAARGVFRPLRLLSGERRDAPAPGGDADPERPPE